MLSDTNRNESARYVDCDGKPDMSYQKQNLKTLVPPLSGLGSENTETNMISPGLRVTLSHPGHEESTPEARQRHQASHTVPGCPLKSQPLSPATPERCKALSPPQPPVKSKGVTPLFQPNVETASPNPRPVTPVSVHRNCPVPTTPVKSRDSTPQFVPHAPLIEPGDSQFNMRPVTPNSAQKKVSLPSAPMKSRENSPHFTPKGSMPTPFSPLTSERSAKPGELSSPNPSTPPDYHDFPSPSASGSPSGAKTPASHSSAPPAPPTAPLKSHDHTPKLTPTGKHLEGSPVSGSLAPPPSKSSTPGSAAARAGTRTSSPPPPLPATPLKGQSRNNSPSSRSGCLSSPSRVTTSTPPSFPEKASGFAPAAPTKQWTSPGGMLQGFDSLEDIPCDYEDEPLVSPDRPPTPEPHLEPAAGANFPLHHTGRQCPSPLPSKTPAAKEDLVTPGSPMKGPSPKSVLDFPESSPGSCSEAESAASPEDIPSLTLKLPTGGAAARRSPSSSLSPLSGTTPPELVYKPMPPPFPRKNKQLQMRGLGGGKRESPPEEPALERGGPHPSSSFLQRTLQAAMNQKTQRSAPWGLSIDAETWQSVPVQPISKVHEVRMSHTTAMAVEVDTVGVASTSMANPLWAAPQNSLSIPKDIPSGEASNSFSLKASYPDEPTSITLSSVHAESVECSAGARGACHTTASVGTNAASSSSGPTCVFSSCTFSSSSGSGAAPTARSCAAGFGNGGRGSGSNEVWSGYSEQMPPSRNTCKRSKKVESGGEGGEDDGLYNMWDQVKAKWNKFSQSKQEEVREGDADAQKREQLKLKVKEVERLVNEMRTPRDHKPDSRPACKAAAPEAWGPPEPRQELDGDDTARVKPRTQRDKEVAARQRREEDQKTRRAAAEAITARRRAKEHDQAERERREVADEEMTRRRREDEMRSRQQRVKDEEAQRRKQEDAYERGRQRQRGGVGGGGRPRQSSGEQSRGASEKISGHGRAEDKGSPVRDGRDSTKGRHGRKASKENSRAHQPERPGIGSSVRRTSAWGSRSVSSAEWARHEQKWVELETSSESICIGDVPWPPCADLRSILSSAFATLPLAENVMSPDKDARKQIYRKWLLRWHPDKFQARFGARLEPSHRDAVLERVQVFMPPLVPGDIHRYHSGVGRRPGGMPPTQPVRCRHPTYVGNIAFPGG
ncbi:hypothetical protein CYMTET_19167 [Cymbomonas tetramitiformis]|uniref:Uncharacterized protein n=1 Tax=Cymbomonas tetramitiformis TaxID=36881 RepID=A0AAE0G726_9CHLO|nr:hypothetical protein CYMTET_19167 [Cymbomonas tetramitiformis]